MATRMLQRRGTAFEWASVNPVLGQAEFGVEVDTGVIKLGDGETAWTQLEPAFEAPPVTSVFGRTGAITASSADLIDRTATGESLFTAVDAQAARSAIGAGMGNGNVIGEGVLKILAISQQDYDALPVKDGTTLYAIPVA